MIDHHHLAERCELLQAAPAPANAVDAGGSLPGCAQRKRAKTGVDRNTVRLITRGEPVKSKTLG